jgi:hypothetical protein
VVFVRDEAVGDLGDVVARDPEVRQARMIARAARTRLVANVAGSQSPFNPAEAHRMLDALTAAQAHAEDAEDRVLVHRGVLTEAEAEARAAHRRPAPRAGAGGGDPRPPAAPGDGRALALAGMLVPVAFGLAGLAGAAIARRISTARR